MRISNLLGETVADGTRTVAVRMRFGVQNLDGSHMEPGETYTVPDSFAHQIIASGRGVRVEADAPAVDPTAITSRDPVVESRDPAPKKGRK